MAEAYGNQISYPFAYQPEYRVVELAVDTARYFSSRIKLLLQGLHERDSLVLLVDEAMDEDLLALISELGYRPNGHTLTQVDCTFGLQTVELVRHLLPTYDDGSVVDMEELTCSAAEVETISSMVTNTYSDDSPLFAGLPGAAYDMEAKDMFVMTKDERGRIVTLFKVGRAGEGFTLEMVTHDDSDNGTRLSTLLLVPYLLRMGADAITFKAPAMDIEALLNQIGMCQSTTYQVFLHGGGADVTV